MLRIASGELRVWTAVHVLALGDASTRAAGFQDLKKLIAALDAHSSKLTKGVGAPARAVA
jgi:hypothetical protein